MKTKLLFLFLLPVSLFAQDYQIVRSNFIHFFHFQDGDDSKFHGFKEDSVHFVDGDSIFYNYLHTRTDEEPCEMMPFSPSFLGLKVVVDSSGWTYMFNRDMDTIAIKVGSQLTDSFVCHRINEDSLILATVTGIQQEDWLDSITNVKTFDLQLTDSLGTLLAHPINGQSVKISETLGALEIPDIFYFPNDTNVFKLVGMEAPNRGVYRMNYGEVFDFEVGDEFHYLETVSNWNGYSHNRIEKWVVTSVQNDGISREIDFEVMINQDASGTPINYDTIYTTVDTVFVDDINELISEVMPGQAVLMWGETSWSDSSILNYEPMFYGKSLCGAPEITVNDYAYYEWMPDTAIGGFCYEEYQGVSPWQGTENSYGLGLGITKVFAQSNGDGQYFSRDTKLVYFKKGQEECGDPFTLSELLGVSRHHEEPVQIFPNPVLVGNQVKIGGLTNQKVSISTIDGKSLSRQLENGMLKTDGLDPGLYLIRIETETGIVTKKLSVIN